MAKTKYQQYYDLLLQNNRALFDKFKPIHDRFNPNDQTTVDEFHRVGRDVLDAIRSYERRLCSGMERTNNSVYSNQVAEKYWNLIRQDFPLIDQIGVTTRQVKV